MFTVDPVNQEQLIELLTHEDRKQCKKNGRIYLMGLHRSIDGTKVTMYAQWQSIEDYQKMRNNPDASPYLQQALKIAKFESGMYEVVETFLPLA